MAFTALRRPSTNIKSAQTFIHQEPTPVKVDSNIYGDNTTTVSEYQRLNSYKSS